MLFNIVKRTAINVRNIIDLWMKLLSSRKGNVICLVIDIAMLLYSCTEEAGGGRRKCGIINYDM
jgi:sulfatase maturation enzyme AslB (radical SAM superfamily)